MQYLNENPYFDKYSEKIKHLQSKDSKTFEERLNALEAEKKRENQTESISTQNIKQTEDNLNSIVNLDTLLSRSSEEITEIWLEYHKNKDCIYTSMNADDFNIIYQKSLECQNFIYPLPRGGGYEFFLQKWSGRICHFTSLSEFQKLNENARPCLNLHHYTELATEKDLVLMRGFPDLTKITVHESQLLALQLKMYYGRTSALRFNLVRLFNKSPENFQHLDLLLEFENFKKDTLDKREFCGPLDGTKTIVKTTDKINIVDKNVGSSVDTTDYIDKNDWVVL